MNIPYLLFGKSIKRKLAAGELRPKGFEGMVPAGEAPDGLEYYQWASMDDLPPIRLKNIERVMIWMDARVTLKSIEDYEEEQVKYLVDIVKEKDEHKRYEKSVKLGQLYKELILRGSTIIPEFLFYDLTATLMVSEKEDPHGFDQVIHQKKIDNLRRWAASGHSFFLDLRILKRLWHSLVTSEAGFKELLTSWTTDSERKTIARDRLSFASGSRSTAGSSTTSPSGSAAAPPKASTL